LSPKIRNSLIGVAVLALAIFSKVIMPTGKPHVVVRAERLFGPESFPFTNALLLTLIVDVVLILLAFAATKNLQLIPRGFQNMMEWLIESLYNTFREINRENVDRAFPLVGTIFFFVLFSNWLGLIPGVGSVGLCMVEETKHQGATIELHLAASRPVEGWIPAKAQAETKEGPQTCPEGKVFVPFFRSPSADLNVTFALALIVFCYIEYLGFQALGIGYLGKFFNFKEGFMGFVVGLLELISEFARILAFAFRLFGNIFAGEVVLVVMAFLIPLALPLPFYFFEVFVGLIQAFVFAVLTMAFISLAVTAHGGGHNEAHH